MLKSLVLVALAGRPDTPHGITCPNCLIWGLVGGRNVISEGEMWLPFLAPAFSWTGISWPQNGLCGRQFWKWIDLVTEHKVNTFMLTLLGYDLTNINWSLKRKEVMRHSTDLHVSILMWRPHSVPGERIGAQQVSELGSQHVPNHSTSPGQRRC